MCIRITIAYHIYVLTTLRRAKNEVSGIQINYYFYNFTSYLLYSKVLGLGTVTVQIELDVNGSLNERESAVQDFSHEHK